VTLLESEEVAGFVVGLAVGPAMPKDTDPFECQGADGCIVGAALGPLAFIECLCPERQRYGLAEAPTAQALGLYRQAQAQPGDP
jgi:hypothetical protein